MVAVKAGDPHSSVIGEVEACNWRLLAAWAAAVIQILMCRGALAGTVWRCERGLCAGDSATDARSTRG